MKRKKSTVAILLVLAILILGIGYAVAARELFIKGTLGATVNLENFKVKFTDCSEENEIVATVADTTNAIAEADIVDDLNATFSVTGFTCKDDCVVIEYEVTNESVDLNATVAATVDSANIPNSDYFSVAASFASNSPSATIEAQDSATLYVTVTCIKTPIENVPTSTSTGGIVKLEANPVT